VPVQLPGTGGVSAAAKSSFFLDARAARTGLFLLSQFENFFEDSTVPAVAFFI
jgi:hypothetical protein